MRKGASSDGVGGASVAVTASVGVDGAAVGVGTGGVNEASRGSSDAQPVLKSIPREIATRKKRDMLTVQ